MRRWMKLIIVLTVLLLSFGFGMAVAAQGSEEFPLDETLLAETLKTIAFAGGAGALAYYVMKYIGVKLAKSGWSDFQIRLASLAVTALIAWTAWFVLFWLIDLSIPTTAQEWVNKLYAIAIGSWAANQLVHGLGQKRKEHGV